MYTKYVQKGRSWPFTHLGFFQSVSKGYPMAFTSSRNTFSQSSWFPCGSHGCSQWQIVSRTVESNACFHEQQKNLHDLMCVGKYVHIQTTNYTDHFCCGWVIPYLLLMDGLYLILLSFLVPFQLQHTSFSSDSSSETQLKFFRFALLPSPMNSFFH